MGNPSKRDAAARKVVGVARTIVTYQITTVSIERRGLARAVNVG